MCLCAIRTPSKCDGLSDTIRDRMDTMASVFVRQSQALEVIIANTLHTVGMTNLWRRWLTSPLNWRGADDKLSEAPASCLIVYLTRHDRGHRLTRWLIKSRPSRRENQCGGSHSGSSSHRSQSSPQPYHQRDNYSRQRPKELFTL